MLPPDSSWDLPGYDVLQRLGTGSSGELWQGRERATGELVVLRRLVGADPADVAASLALLPDLPAEHLVRLRDVHQVEGATQGAVVLVLEHAPGGSLTGRRLTPGQVVTALAPVAQLLAEVDALGGQHGRIAASEVLLSDDGKPLLDGLGLSGVRSSLTEDLAALQALGLQLLHGQHGPVRDVLESGGHDLASLAAGLLRACPAEPLLPAGPPVSRPLLPPPAPVRGRRRWPLALVPVVALVAVVALLPRHEEPVDWRQVLTGLDTKRAAAFAHADTVLLRDVYTATSRALADETGRLKELSGRHESVLGLLHRFLSVDLAHDDGQRVQLDVVAALTSYRIVGVGGATREVRAARPVRQRLVLIETAAGWRIEQLSAADEQPVKR